MHPPSSYTDLADSNLRIFVDIHGNPYVVEIKPGVFIHYSDYKNKGKLSQLISGEELVTK